MVIEVKPEAEKLIERAAKSMVTSSENDEFYEWLVKSFK